MRQINLPPNALAMMESTRAIGYSLKTAIADVIDNSIAAKAKNIWISFFPTPELYIAIMDDGCGMDSGEITRAMQYGGDGPLGKRSKNDLGRFGLGMKTASLSQCEMLTVFSKKAEKIEIRRWDLNYIKQSDKWTLQELNIDEAGGFGEIDALKGLRHGTLLIWQQLDRLKQGDSDFSIARKMDEVRKHLALVFHRYLSGEKDIKKVNMYINDVKIEPIDPFLTSHNTQAIADENIKLNKKIITVRSYMLPHPSKMTNEEKKMLGVDDEDGLRKGQGFYVYRNKRLIVWGTWFGMARKSTLSKLARVQVDIPNDFDDLWVLDVKKSSAIPPIAIRRNLSAIIDNMVQKSKRTWTYRGKKETSDKIHHIWNRLKTREGGWRYEINAKHPMISQLIRKAPECENEIKSILNLIAAMLPLNQLQVDFDDDRDIENDSMIDEDKARLMLSSLMENLSREKQRSLAELLKTTEPFSSFERIFDEYK
ncbi:MAG: ATP-binding protein [Selenomonadaceae bacterium]